MTFIIVTNFIFVQRTYRALFYILEFLQLSNGDERYAHPLRCLEALDKHYLSNLALGEFWNRDEGVVLKLGFLFFFLFFCDSQIYIYVYILYIDILIHFLLVRTVYWFSSNKRIAVFARKIWYGNPIKVAPVVLTNKYLYMWIDISFLYIQSYSPFHPLHFVKLYKSLYETLQLIKDFKHSIFFYYAFIYATLNKKLRKIEKIITAFCARYYVSRRNGIEPISFPPFSPLSLFFFFCF
ncbi:hypothetical protein PUN28_017498 [Cardiocondyla obscurior]|uniref:Uncharacterized protein n=1 Tax=Cardiocondyla obscurior TaxID=286306 RepID=A0AAW2EJV0_9HYME